MVGSSDLKHREPSRQPAVTILSVLRTLLSVGVLLAAGLIVMARVANLADPDREVFAPIIKTFAWLPLASGIVVRLLAGHVASLCWPLVATIAALTGTRAGAGGDEVLYLTLLAPFAVLLPPLAALLGLGIGEMLRRFRQSFSVLRAGDPSRFHE